MNISSHQDTSISKENRQLTFAFVKAPFLQITRSGSICVPDAEFIESICCDTGDGGAYLLDSEILQTGDA